ncbi:membrane spanning protein [Carbonactinospora thermoautotrophica]|uniref:Membrane spanning protein n=1 Tax=Carbonactinospora thermoautotrophica TaxID=1469144 RepID=A0A132MLS2_9ACTN|nr:Rv3654c family TadE-like protein [Carbonactinospora thermoautotrophica]KWW98814.1 membrane spanning protein [Carbonactinospora thermoautotrophica]
MSHGGDAGGAGGRDRGAATVYATALIGVVWLAGLATLTVTRAVEARHRAGAAADLAALAAADRALDGATTACAAAGMVVKAHQAHLATCTLRGEIAEVTAEVRLPGVLALIPPARVRARAGPIEEVPAGVPYRVQHAAVP